MIQQERPAAGDETEVCSVSAVPVFGLPRQRTLYYYSRVSSNPKGVIEKCANTIRRFI
jgi:hypothetical protein